MLESEQQSGLLQMLLGLGERQRLVRVMALLQSGEKPAAEKELESLSGTGLYSLGAFVRILFELPDGTLAQTQALLEKYRESGATGAELAMAEVTMMSASGQTDRIGRTLSRHLEQEPSNDRIRLLLARWELTLGRRPRSRRPTAVPA